MSATGLNKFEFLKPDNDYYLYHTTRGNLVKISPTGTGGFQFWDLTKESEEGEFAIIFRIGTFCAVWFEDWGISDSLLPNEFLFSIGNGSVSFCVGDSTFYWTAPDTHGRRSLHKSQGNRSEVGDLHYPFLQLKDGETDVYPNLFNYCAVCAILFFQNIVA